MLTLNIDKIEEGESQSFEIWVDGHRRITISCNKHFTSVQFPSAIHSESMSITEGSTYIRTKDIG